mmetsp:Transcript_13072/g.40261  ORF Transcript_13072/g.40261 Transcript_13072/m.40261 type:complete len:308 (+) Transcript_13072:162-1085(+)|eukprot:CAMPEP_0198730712 /NCGR_PEP_ID=MMETSP1475-20131203/25777_1 /TAXON_ID= ORGANISM="Unidentified sp., Strain CCMP1999" /NCGR_SAMPLE_ID=MMETSP1475 /ASSEMBLY_ACC=CAM_ASM_001111 /LENGTH=307 /DNA_ID=CAMNT_0044493557 /DNA_START=96 /DNA_END=1019 /DNA_ORIENTATION=+
MAPRRQRRRKTADNGKVDLVDPATEIAVDTQAEPSQKQPVEKDDLFEDGGPTEAAKPRLKEEEGSADVVQIDDDTPVKSAEDGAIKTENGADDKEIQDDVNTGEVEIKTETAENLAGKAKDEVAEVEGLEDSKQPSTGRLPLVCAPKLDDSIVIAEASDLSFDLSGDVGAVGRIKIADQALSLDLKGIFYDTRRVASNSLCVVAVGDTEARITSATDEYLVLTESREVFGGERVLAGTIDFGGNEDDDDGPSGAAGEKVEGAGVKRKNMDEDYEEKPKAKAPKKKSEGRKSSSSSKPRGKRKPGGKK